MLRGAGFWNDPIQTLTIRVVGFCASNCARSSGANAASNVRHRAKRNRSFMFGSLAHLAFWNETFLKAKSRRPTPKWPFRRRSRLKGKEADQFILGLSRT